MAGTGEPPTALTGGGGGRIAAIAALVVLGALVVGLLVLLGQLYQLPMPERPTRASGTTLELAAADGLVFALRGGAQGRAVELAALPDHLIDAVMVMEDRRFFDHHGVDLVGIARAAWANLTAGEAVQGGSTITQQLAKTLFLSPARTWSRKLQEVMLALWLERRLTKGEILARYLDAVYFGAGAHGVEAAARRYFGKPATALTLVESAMLAGLIQAPSRFAPTRSLDAARRRAGIVLDAMVEAGVLGAGDARQAKAAPADLVPPPADLPAFGHAADFASAEAERLLGRVSGAFLVETTIDRHLQGLAQATIEAWLARDGEAVGADQAALVALAPDGAILAMAGGRDYRKSQFNRAVQARRQPGSLFKLFVYLAALSDGRGPESPIEDAPLTIDGWQPRNYGGHHLGPTDLRTAFARSLNSAAVRLQEEVGRERVIALARAMGISTPLQPHPSLALGSAEVTLLELTAAYAAVLAHVGRVEPHVVQAVATPGGERFRRSLAAPGEATWPRAPIMDLLGEVVRSGTGRAAALDRPVYGKTGTTQGHRDAWFVGFVEELVVGVWVGNDDDRPMDGVTGGGLPADIWRSFVMAAAPGRAPAVALGTSERPHRRLAPTMAGPPTIVDTATLLVQGEIVQLEGVVGLGGRHRRDLAAHLRDRRIVCRSTASRRGACQIDGADLAETVLLSGLARVAPTAALARAQRKARQEGRGIWSTPAVIRGH